MPVAAQQPSHLQVPAQQIGMVTFVRKPGDTTNKLYPTSFMHPDGTFTDLQQGIPAPYSLVITDISLQVFRTPGTSAIYPLLCMANLYSWDMYQPGAAFPCLHEMFPTFPAGVASYGFKDSFTTGFAFSGSRLPVFTVTVYNNNTSSGFGTVQAYGYLVSAR